jgi:DNA-binding response OmpR family regulator
MSKRILVIEDEKHIQRLIKMILEKQTYEVTLKSNGEEGLDEISSANTPFDLILLDIMMPGMDGIEVLRNIKSKDETKSIPVMMLTALAQENVVVEGIKLGAKDYIRKPFSPKELIERVSKVL